MESESANGLPSEIMLILLKIGIPLTAIGILCLVLIIPSFLFSKELKAHPGSLILGMCLAEITMYYGYFWMMMLILDRNGEWGVNIFKFISETLGYLSQGIIHPTEGTIFLLSSTFSSTCLEISVWYYAFISLDVVLLLRNPFYSPQRRIILYHFCAVIIPLSLFLPFRVTAADQTIISSIKLPLKNQTAQYIDIIINLFVSISCISSMIYSWIRIKKFTISTHHRKIFLFKLIGYTFIGLVYCISSMIQDICMIIIAKTRNFNWLTLYLGCSLVSSLCGISVLPIRMMEPGVWKFISMKIKNFFCLGFDEYKQFQIKQELEKSKTYYSFIHTSLNGELASSILQGITCITEQNYNSFDERTNFSINAQAKIMRRPQTIYIPEKLSPRKKLKEVNRGSQMENLAEDIKERRFSMIFDPKRNEASSSTSSKNIVHTTYSTGKQSVKITEYEANIFESIREHFNIKNKDLLAAVDPVSNKSNIFSVGEGEGRSGSFFIFTFDKQFIIKTISPHEMTVFLKFLPRYQRRLTALNRSLISKIYGAFSVKMRGVVAVYFILMENSLPTVPGYEMEYIFDLKGSLVNRFVKPKMNKICTLKDINFLQLRSHKPFLNFKNSTIRIYKDMLIRDVNFLQHSKIMDYSLLFGIGKRKKTQEMKNHLKICKEYPENEKKYAISEDKNFVYYLSIIDYFQLYDMNKKLEHAIKAITLNSRKVKNLSSVPPKKYANRFLTFAENKIFAKK